MAVTPVTMRDVAARAGVSPTVVSHVINNRAAGVRVSPATAERVKQAALELGYRMNVMARNFRERQTMMIGVLHGIGFGRHRFDGDSRYFAALMDGIVDSAFENGYSVTLCPKLMGDSPEDAMADGRFDGLVWYSASLSSDNRRMLQACTVPLVMLHTEANEFGNRIPTVSCDNRQGVGLAVEHLVELGHRRIGFVTSRHYFLGEAVQRRDAFLLNMARQNLIVGEEDVVFSGDVDHEFDEIFASRRYTALICTHDGIAALVMRQAHQFGLDLPEDLSVVGIDSTSYCDGLRPTLTSVSQPLVNIGQCAVDLLVQSIRGKAPVPSVTFPCGLDIRGSTTSIAIR